MQQNRHDIERNGRIITLRDKAKRINKINTGKRRNASGIKPKRQKHERLQDWCRKTLEVG